MSCELCCVTGSVCQIVTVNSSPRLHFIFSSHLLLHLSCLFIHPFLFICPAPVTAPHSSTYVSIFFAPPPSVSYQFNFSLTLQLWSLIKAADWVQSQVIRYRFISAGTPPPHRHYNRSTDIYYCSGLGPPYTRLHCREWAIVKCLDTVLMSFITEHQKSLTPVYEARARPAVKWKLDPFNIRTCESYFVFKYVFNGRSILSVRLSSHRFEAGGTHAHTSTDQLHAAAFD